MTEEPTQTCASGVPTSSSTGATLPGDEGLAISGVSVGEVDVLLLVEVAGVAGRELREVVRALLLLQPLLGLGVRREDRARRAELGDHVRDRPALGVTQARRPGPGELEDRAAPTANAASPQQLEDDVLGRDPRPCELVLEEDADDLRTGQLERMPGHADRGVQPAGADRDHRAGAGLGRVAVGADQQLAGRGEALAMDVVADAVPGPREPEAVAGGETLEEAVVVRVLEIDLEEVVVDVLDGGLDLDAVDAELLELHQRHRPGRVLRQRLVDAEGDLGSGGEFAADEVVVEDLSRERGHLLESLSSVEGMSRSRHGSVSHRCALSCVCSQWGGGWWPPAWRPGGWNE